MRATALATILLAIASLTGCTRKPPAVSAKSSGSAPALTVVHPATGSASGFASQPRTPADWAERLQTHDQFARVEAARSLADLGKEGWPHLLRGMSSESWETRLTCLRVASRDQIMAHSRETLPLLSRLLEDPQPAIRSCAAIRLGWFGAGAKSTFPSMKSLLQAETDPLIKRDLMESILAVNSSPELLADLLRDRDRLIRKEAATRLAGMALHGFSIEAARPTLETVVETEPDAEIQTIERAALIESRKGRASQ